MLWNVAGGSQKRPCLDGFYANTAPNGFETTEGITASICGRGSAAVVHLVQGTQNQISKLTRFPNGEAGGKNDGCALPHLKNLEIWFKLEI